MHNFFTSIVRRKISKKEIPYLQAAMYYFVYYINDTNYGVLINFPKIPNIFKNSPNIVRRLPKMSEDFRVRCFDCSQHLFCCLDI